jgi:putative copper resistance protein D
MIMIITRTVHIGACLILLSLFAFEILIATPSLRQADRSALQDVEALRGQFRWLATWSGFAAIGSGIAWFWIVLARITGGSLWAMPSMDSIQVAITRTQFGRLWEWRLGLMLLFTMVHLFASKKWWNVSLKSRASQCVGAIVATTLLTSLAWAGHADATLGAQRAVHLTADAAHLAVAGLWPGGLLPLTFFLVRASRSNEPSLSLVAGSITRRFSALSLLVVSALAATGFVNSYFLVGSLRALVASGYGRLLIVKLFLFLILIGLGAWNLLRLKPQLTSAGQRDDQQRAALRKLMRNVIAELCLGTLIVLIVGALGVTPPPRHRV